MDKKSLIGLLLVGVILFGYSWWQTKNTEKNIIAQREAYITDSLANPQKYLKNINATIEEMQHAELVAKQLEEAKQKFQAEFEKNLGSSLTVAMTGEEEFYTLENEVMTMTISSLGAKVVNVEMKDYRKWSQKGDGNLVKLFDPQSAEFDLSFYLRKGYNESKINTASFYFTNVEGVVSGSQSVDGEIRMYEQISMQLPIDENAYVEFIYTMYPDQYMVDFDVQFVGMQQWMQTGSFDIAWSNTSYQNEKGYQNENNYTTISYKFSDEKKLEELGVADAKKGEGRKSELISTEFEWFAFKQQFFSSVFIADEGFQNGDLSYTTYRPGTGFVKDFLANVTVPFNTSKQKYDFQFYFGPNKYSVLKAYDEGLEGLVQLGGWAISWVNSLIVIPIFDFLSKYMVSYGLIILILTLLIKLLIFPLTYKSYLSSAKMRSLKPEITAISEKYPNKDDAMKKQQATMELYKKCGVSPMGGCLPMLIQMPILFALFRFFPTSIELRGQRFLWAEDLSAYDSIFELPFNIPFYGDHVSLFTLLMAVSMFFFSKINYEQTASAGGPTMPGMKFMMVYMMPVMMVFFFNNYASGLCYYYFLSQIITIIQTTAFRYGVNEEKLHAKLIAASVKNAKKPKSKWQLRMEDMQKQQRAAAIEQEKRQYKGKR